MNYVRDVIQWYEGWVSNRPSGFLRGELRFMEPDILLGKVVIELELGGLASDLREFSLDDRCIRSDESVPVLLDRYIEQIIALPE
jgi:hypothetical protein